MTFISYLATSFSFRIFDFFIHWYWHSFKIYTHFVVSTLERWDRFFAFKITLKNLFEPLYQDRTFIGYLLGFIFRSLRLILGGAVYGILIAVAAALYVVWLIIPIYIFYRILEPIVSLSGK